MFLETLGGSGWLRASDRFLLVFKERRADFLRLRASLESAGVGLLVRGSCDWLWKCEFCGSGFKFSRSVIVR